MSKYKYKQHRLAGNVAAPGWPPDFVRGLLVRLLLSSDLMRYFMIPSSLGHSILRQGRVF
jgi:hypothetical protein